MIFSETQLGSVKKLVTEQWNQEELFLSKPWRQTYKLQTAAQFHFTKHDVWPE